MESVSVHSNRIPGAFDTQACMAHFNHLARLDGPERQPSEVAGGDDRDGAERGQRDDDLRQLRAAAEDQDSGRGADELHVHVQSRGDGEHADGDDRSGTRWKKTTLDGFGRATQVETGHDATTVSRWWIPSMRRARARRWGSCSGCRSRMRRAGRRCGRLTPTTGGADGEGDGAGRERDRRRSI